MLRKSLVSALVASVLFVGFATSSKADKFQYATQTGTVTQDSVNYMTIYVNASTYTPDDPFTAPQINGTISISGFTGLVGLSLGATVKSVSYGQIIVQGRTVSQAVVLSKTFNYQNLNNHTRTQAFMKVTVTKVGRGTIVFQVIDSVTKATLASSTSSNGEIIPISLATGSTTIIF